MKNELPVTVDVCRHDTSYARSLLSLLYAGLPAMKPSGLKKGCVLARRREEGRGPVPDLFPLLVLLQSGGGGQCLSPQFPSRALEQDEVIADASMSSQAHYFASCMPRCCCFLHQASLIYMHNTSTTAHLVLFTINRFCSDRVSDTKDLNGKERRTSLGEFVSLQTCWLVDKKTGSNVLSLLCYLCYWCGWWGVGLVFFEVFEIGDFPGDQLHQLLILGVLSMSGFSDILFSFEPASSPSRRAVMTYICFEG